MDKAAVVEIIGKFHQGLLSRGIGPNKIVLFGSYATHSHREDSDIDLAVISDDFKKMNYWERIDLLTEVIFEIFAPIEATAFTQEEWERGDSFVADYAKNGEIYFAA
ncbi:putative nucleotidyltransferase [Pseudoalteromonas luteoviolacea 2ta16]|uniref:Putative nucleotidyltransferase n=1 Tax=Pseudoalteromonas luteoviolacea (strain 2ta16) TaxID=1353533 RepID=V4H620_PSEL2|nr:nucleotidyltransferase domain-containing protein [Pseudoalteromonas luteoviolacea]ESP92916.1 putative nucleotidyltransferase [Pseudoalteromonas luteoviolacea 2ta16]